MHKTRIFHSLAYTDTEYLMRSLWFSMSWHSHICEVGRLVKRKARTGNSIYYLLFPLCPVLCCVLLHIRCHWFSNNPEEYFFLFLFFYFTHFIGNIWGNKLWEIVSLSWFLTDSTGCAGMTAQVALVTMPELFLLPSPCSQLNDFSGWKRLKSVLEIHTEDLTGL